MTKLTRVEEVKKILVKGWLLPSQAETAARLIDKYYCQLFPQPLSLGRIDKELYWQIKAILCGVQIEQRNNPNITWGTTLDAVLKRMDELEKFPQPLDAKGLREKLQDTYGVIKFGFDAYERYKSGESKADDWNLFQYELDQILALLSKEYMSKEECEECQAQTECKIEEAKELLRAQVPNLIEEQKEQERERIEALFADNTGTTTFIRKRDNKAGVEECHLIIKGEWQALKEKEDEK